nr:MAG TPA: hypothetical protein [Caudoviricetes sp.]
MIYEFIIYDLKSSVNYFFDFFSYFFIFFIVSLDLKSFLLYNRLIECKEKKSWLARQDT